MIARKTLSTKERVAYNFEDLSGQRFGRLVVRRFERRGGSRGGRTRVFWICSCDCGNEHAVAAEALKQGFSRSCGCLQKEGASERRRTHGLSKTDVYNIWLHIIDRCTNPKSNSFPNYGGRGISICGEWLNSFEAFASSVGPRPSKRHSIDRYPDMNGNYEPGNVRWATAQEQGRNRRGLVIVEFRGEGRYQIRYRLLPDRRSRMVGRPSSLRPAMVEEGRLMPRSVPEWIGKTPDTPPPPRVKLRIFEREGGICYLSGRKIQPGEKWQADHKVAIINGGENRESNLFPALVDKHAEKTKRDVAEKASVAARAKSHIGAVSPGRPIPGPSFRPGKRRASNPMPSLPPRPLFAPKGTP